MRPAFPDVVTEIHGRPLPEPGIPAGYAALIAAYGLDVDLPQTLGATGQRHRIYEQGGWRLLTPRHRPAATLEGHLTFALKYEGVDLAVLKALFEAIDQEALAALIRARPTGRYMRRVWFLAEWLTGRQLDLPPLRRASYVDALDPHLQYAGRSVNSPRHRVRNNLPGTPAFCPLVFRTPALGDLASTDYGMMLRRFIADAPEEHRPYLWLAFARAEASPRGAPESPRAVLQQWKRGTMGRPEPTLSLDEIALLKQQTRSELLECYPNLDAVLGGAFAYAEHAGPALPSPLTAACLAFGFARALGETDPYERVHRYLAQKYFAYAGYGAAGYMVPVSVIAHQIRMPEYRGLLASSRPSGLFDATPHAEFYYRCLAAAIRIVLPKALSFAAEKYKAESMAGPDRHAS